MSLCKHGHVFYGVNRKGGGSVCGGLPNYATELNPPAGISANGLELVDPAVAAAAVKICCCSRSILQQQQQQQDSRHCTAWWLW